MHALPFERNVLSYSIVSTPPKVVNSITGQWSSFVCVRTPANRVSTLLDTSGEAHIIYVISHDLVNLTIFCHDYKLCLSTIIAITINDIQ